jgi:hypothetical protein
VVSRAAWTGDRLVIVTHRTVTMSWPDRLPVEFERQHTFRETMALDGGELVVDHLAISDPLPGGTAKRIDGPPSSWSCRYRKAG